MKLGRCLFCASHTCFTNINYIGPPCQPVRHGFMAPKFGLAQTLIAKIYTPVLGLPRFVFVLSFVCGRQHMFSLVLTRFVFVMFLHCGGRGRWSFIVVVPVCPSLDGLFDACNRVALCNRIGRLVMTFCNLGSGWFKHAAWLFGFNVEIGCVRGVMPG